MSKPRLFIDVDGVLFGEYDGYLQLRPNVVGFLRWSLKHFDCRWLTVWGPDQLATLFSHIYGGDLATHILWTPWQNDGGGKAAAIDVLVPFFWIEDGILPREQAYLDEHGVGDRFIDVNPKGRDELEHVRQLLIPRAGIGVVDR